MSAQIHPVDQATDKAKVALMDWHRRHTQVMDEYRNGKYRDNQERFEVMAAEIAVLRRSVGK